jgi:hypothetical protein
MKRKNKKFHMVKEPLVGCFLVLMLAAAIVNIHFLTKLTERVTGLIDEAEKSASEENWDKAVGKAEEAIGLWDGSDTYTHLVLRHSELESATDALYGFLEQVYAKEEGNAKGAAEAAKAHMKSISSIEQIKPGSVF